MWNFEDTGFGASGGFDGGFMPNSTNATVDTSKTARGKQSVVSVVIQQILNCESDDFEMWGSSPLNVKIVGILEKLHVETSLIRYRISDHTGVINGMVTIGDQENDQEEVNSFLQVVENTYVKVIGMVNVIDGRKCIIVLDIAPVCDLNEYITHLLNSIHIRFSLEKKLQEKNSLDIRIKASGTELGNSMYNFSNVTAEKESNSASDDYFNSNSDMQGLSNFQQKVYRYIREGNEVAGISSKIIKSKFPLPDHKEVDKTLEFLLSLGYIYTTIDEDHFRATNE